MKVQIKQVVNGFVLEIDDGDCRTLKINRFEHDLL